MAVDRPQQAVYWRVLLAKAKRLQQAAAEKSKNTPVGVAAADAHLDAAETKENFERLWAAAVQDIKGTTGDQQAAHDLLMAAMRTELLSD